MNYKIDNLQYCKWSREVFEINRQAGLDAVHVTVAVSYTHLTLPPNREV